MLSSDGYYGEHKRLDHHGDSVKLNNNQDLICFLSMYLINRTLINQLLFLTSQLWSNLLSSPR